MTTSVSSPAVHDALSDADRAALDRALTEPGIVMNADELAELLAAGGDDEVRELLAVGRVAEALGVAKFNVAEATYNWDEPRNRSRPVDDWPE